MHGKHELRQPTMKLTAYGGTDIPNLGSCHVYVNNPSSKVIQAQVVDVHGPEIIGNTSVQALDLLKLNWVVEVKSNTGSIIPPVGHPVKQDLNIPTGPQDVKFVDVQGKQHPFLLTKDFLLTEYRDIFTGIDYFPGAPYHIETVPDSLPIQHGPRQVPV